MNTIPNLDCQTSDDLMDFWARYHRGSRRDAAELIGDKRPLFTVYARNVAAYACNKAVAMQCRLRGEIDSATTYETICDQIYNRLPEDLRW